MIPVLYINLDRDADRRARMEAEFSRHGVAGQRFPATLWTALPQAEQDALYSAAQNARQFHLPLVNGEKGCYASHLAAWQWLLDSPHAAAVVLEDDVALTPKFNAVIDAVVALPAGWDMVKLIGREQEKLASQRPLIEGIELVDYKRVPSLTAGYLISRSGAAKLLASRKPFGRPIDVDLRHWWENDLRIQGVMPAAIVLDESSFQSSIGQKPRGARWRKFLHKAAYSFNNWRHSR